MCIVMDPEAVLAVRRDLLGRELALTSVRVEAPDAEVSTALIRAAVERVTAMVDAVAADLRGLAEALAELVADLERRDDGATARFALLTKRCRP